MCTHPPTLTDSAIIRTPKQTRKTGTPKTSTTTTRKKDINEKNSNSNNMSIGDDGWGEETVQE